MEGPSGTATSAARSDSDEEPAACLLTSPLAAAHDLDLLARTSVPVGQIRTPPQALRMSQMAPAIPAAISRLRLRRRLGHVSFMRKTFADGAPWGVIPIGRYRA